jgi:hypothetical protein
VRVNINGAGHQVEIECDHPDPGYVIEKAQRLYEETRPTAKADKAGPATAGFQMQQAYQPGHGPYGADFRLGERPDVQGRASDAPSS